MWEDLLKNLGHNPVVTIAIFVWPIGVAVVTRWLGRRVDGRGFGWEDAFYLALATYIGAGEPDSSPKNAFLKWLTLINGLFGLFAWAYVIAILVVSLR